MQTSRTRIFAVAGSPVLHSKSPAMFNAAFEKWGMNACYTRIAASNVRDVVSCAKEMGLAGINITSPFKEEVIPLLDNVEGMARKIGAVNTVVISRGEVKGYNTDGEGVVRALLAADVDLSGRKAVVIGAGGSAKAAVFGLLSEGADVVILNRTFQKALALAENSGCRAAPFEDMGTEVESADILVSCLPSGERIIEPSFLRKGLAVLDANYSVETLLVKDAKERGCRVIDGREWLLYQGAGSFRHFFGIEPPLSVMRKALYGGEFVPRKNIALVGFMGTGKSTVAGCLSTAAGMHMKDIDSEIEKKSWTSIKEIFETEGEDTFRRLESAEIGEIANLSDVVISCGGGAVADRKNVDILKQNCIVVWLWAGVDTVLDRVGSNGDRPLLKGGDKSAVKNLLDSRLPFYARCSDMVVRSEGAGPDEIARKVYEESRKFLDN